VIADLLKKHRDAFALTLAAAAWGTGTVISKRALVEFEPLALLPIQLTASLVVLAVLIRRSGGALLGGPKALVRLGLLNPGLAYALGLLGLVSISASLSVLLWAVEPLLILLLAAVVLRERITVGLGALTVVAVVGMVLLIRDPAMGGGALGVALTLAGVACCAIYTVLARRWLPTAPSTMQVVFGQQLYALGLAIVLVIAAAVAGRSALVAQPTLPGISSAIGSGVLYYGAAYWLYLGALRRVPASIAAGSFYLIPLFGVAGGALLLGDRLDTGQWFGAAITMAAVLGIIRATTLGAEGLTTAPPELADRPADA
jgi:drug/metabolite transporter (DMT)-like permease